MGTPVPLPGATAMFTFTLEPCAIEVVGLRARVVVVARNVAVFHLLTRFATFTDPRPVAKS